MLPTSHHPFFCVARRPQPSSPGKLVSPQGSRIHPSAAGTPSFGQPLGYQCQHEPTGLLGPAGTPDGGGDAVGGIGSGGVKGCGDAVGGGDDGSYTVTNSLPVVTVAADVTFRPVIMEAACDEDNWPLRLVEMLEDAASLSE